MLLDMDCAFGILCNKWRVFHCAIDVRPHFCDVTVKTRCTLHNTVRQRDGFQVQDTLYECPLESVQAVGSRGNVTGTVMGGAQGTGVSLRWGAGRGIVHPGLACRRRLWRRAPLSIGAQLGLMGLESVHRKLMSESWRGLETEHHSGSTVRGTWRGASLLKLRRKGA
jgi:hypothetical protein